MERVPTRFGGRDRFQGPLVLAAVLLALSLSPSRAAEAPAPAISIPPGPEIVKRLKPGHPRLLASDEDFARLREQVKNEQPLKGWHATLIERANRLLLEPASRYEIPDGLRLLSTSRRVLDRVYTLALLYRLGADDRYARRAWKELEAAAAFPDWNPRHFLDTAEMTHAFAIGYDWLYDFWSPAERDLLRNAILKKGLEIAVHCYRGTERFGWWTKAHHNWNQVCNGGIGMGALALADETPELSGEFLHAALESLQLPMAEYAPDGAWKEGPGYWNYATSYNMVFLAALESALGTDFGLSRMNGFPDTGLFPMYLTGPLGRTFNYADGGEGTIRAPAMFWLARHFDRPVYGWYERQVASPRALDLLWFDPRGRGPRASGLSLDQYFRGAEVVTMRSAWEDRDAVFVGFKAGDNKANHSHLDLGSFVLDALGRRWAVDLGADDYNLPGYFGGQRWTYYRMRAEGHNTLVINPSTAPDQDPKAATRIVRFESQPRSAFAIADLTPAYAAQARSVQRGIRLLDRRQILIQDEVRTKSPSELWWFLHTPAQVQLDEDRTSATLSLDNVRLQARLLAPSQARFQVLEAAPLAASPKPEKQAVNRGVRKLGIQIEAATDLRLAVWLAPLSQAEATPTNAPEVISLSRW